LFILAADALTSCSIDKAANAIRPFEMRDRIPEALDRGGDLAGIGKGR
jgi:hypothetical protein